jgi:deoxyadenosine/deoxycytidine kinase
LADPNIRIVFCERSLESSRRVFAQMLRDAGHMTAIEFAIYESMFTNEIVSKYYPTEIVYLEASIDVCHDRICTRDRTGEESIPKEYLSKCAAYYTTWLRHVMVEQTDNRSVNIICTDDLSIDQVLAQFFNTVSIRN